MNFQIPARNLETLNTKIEKLGRKTHKLNLANAPFASVDGVVIYPAHWVGATFVPTKKLYSVNLHGVSPRLPNGWSFVATLEHTPAGNLIKSTPEAGDLPESYRTAKAYCHHCNTTRSRKDTYVLRNDAGELKQVGRTCVKDFLGHATLEQIGNYEAFAELLRDSEDEDRLSFGGDDWGCSPDYMVAMSVEVIKHEGFFSKKTAEMNDRPATSSIVRKNLRPTPSALANGFKPYDISEASVEKAQKVIAWLKTLSPKSDYEWNLKALASLEFVTMDRVGFLASAVVAYDKAVGAELARNAEKAESNHFGTVGERAVFTLTFFKESSFDTMYGVQTIHLFKDASGNIAKWVTGTHTGLEIGNTYTLKATVKKHDDYKGVKQTVLTRCSVEGMK